MIKEFTYSVKGMHCASCEILIEKKLLAQKGIQLVKAKTNNRKVTIKYEGEKPSSDYLNQLFKEENYCFSERSINTVSEHKKNDLGFVFLAGAILILGFLGLNRLGLSSIVNVSSKSSLPMFFVFGLLAGVSTCAALVGGMILSLSKQWNALYTDENSTIQKLEPHFLFNIGRIVTFGILGGVLGFLGKSIGISFVVTSVLVIAVSVFMFFMGLQMLGIKYFQRFQLTTPKFISRYVANEKNFQGRFMPFLMGALTFFLPCGFTITTQGLALISGGPLQGALIMMAFVLGTTPILLGIGFSSLKLSANPHSASRFTKIAGILVLFFALFNLNAQLNVLGLKSFSDVLSKKPVANAANDSGFVPVVGGKQIIKMNASASGYSPNYFKVKVGVPVLWEITDTGTSGCTNAVISKELFEGPINLTPGQISTKEFTPQKTGKYKFSCWMGMISGIIEVVDNSQSSTGKSTVTDNSQVISSGASGCGCGGAK